MTPEWASLAASFEFKVWRSAAKQLGAPYIWTGKGDAAWDVVKGLRPWGASEIATGRKAFDCSGLVTWAAREATGIDVRAKWSAGAIHAATVAHANAPPLFAWLTFYGRPKVDHIAIAFRPRGGLPLPGVVLEAAGAGSDCTSEALAIQKGASVRLTRDVRTDAVGSVPLWALGVAIGALSSPPASP
jgi:hypothetical protein